MMSYNIHLHCNHYLKMIFINSVLYLKIKQSIIIAYIKHNPQRIILNMYIKYINVIMQIISISPRLIILILKTKAIFIL